MASIVPKHRTQVGPFLKQTRMDLSFLALRVVRKPQRGTPYLWRGDVGGLGQGLGESSLLRGSAGLITLLPAGVTSVRPARQTINRVISPTTIITPLIVSLVGLIWVSPIISRGISSVVSGY